MCAYVCMYRCEHIHICVFNMISIKFFYFPFLKINLFILIGGLLLYNILVGFAIHWHESALGVHMSPILNLPPTSLPIPSPWVVPVHWLWMPVSCIELGLVIYFTYDNMHVSVLFSQIIPLSPSPRRVQKSVLYICVSFALLHIGSSLPSF